MIEFSFFYGSLRPRETPVLLDGSRKAHRAQNQNNAQKQVRGGCAWRAPFAPTEHRRRPTRPPAPAEATKAEGRRQRRSPPARIGEESGGARRTARSTRLAQNGARREEGGHTGPKQHDAPNPINLSNNAPHLSGQNAQPPTAGGEEGAGGRTHRNK